MEFSLLLCLCYQQWACIIPATARPDGEQTGQTSATALHDEKREAGTRTARRCIRKPGPKSRWCSSTAKIVHLDRLAVDIRGKSGKVLNRAEIIRALIDGLIDSGMDVTGSASEADLRARVARRLGTPYR